MSKAVDLERVAMLGVSPAQVELHYATAVMSRVNPHKQRENCTAAALAEVCRKEVPGPRAATGHFAAQSQISRSPDVGVVAQGSIDIILLVHVHCDLIIQVVLSDRAHQRLHGKGQRQTSSCEHEQRRGAWLWRQPFTSREVRADTTRHGREQTDAR